MLGIKKPMFLQLNDESRVRVLHAGTTIALEDNLYTSEFDLREELSLQPEDTAFIYWEDNRVFVQQAVRIESCSTEGAKLTVSFETTSDPVSAESRQCYRVSTIRLNLTVGVAEEPNCPLLDISATGISVLTSTRLPLGEEVPVALNYEGEEFAGTVIVQSYREMDDGRSRHGLHCVQSARSGGNLEKGLQKVSMCAQRLLIKTMAAV